MATDILRQLLGALQALTDWDISGNPHELLMLLPSEYADAYRDDFAAAFDSDWVYLFTACIEDFYADHEDVIVKENPKADAVLMDIMEAISYHAEPWLHRGEPHNWAVFVKELKHLSQQLKEVLSA